MKKLILSIIAVLALVCVVVGVTGCYIGAKHEHYYNHTVVKPTCTEKGYTLYKCTGGGCGYSYKGSETAIDPNGHIYDESGFCTLCKHKLDPTDGVVYSLSEDGTYAEVVGYNGSETNVVIASCYNKLPVKSIHADAFNSLNTITSVVIPDSVTSIGRGAFYCCDNLNSVTMPDSLTNIGYQAFSGCSELTSITIPNSTENIDYYAFENCTKLESINIPKTVTSIGDYAFINCTKLTSITVDESNKNYKSIDGNLYNKDGTVMLQYACGKTEMSFAIPETVTSIESSAFYNCKGLTDITISNNITSIGDGAFSHCIGLTSIELPDSVTTIRGWSFAYCSELTSVTIPDSVTRMDSSVFAGCNKLTSITVDENNQNYKSIDGNLYNKDGTVLMQYSIGKTESSFVIPEAVTSIDINAFADCRGLECLTISDNVKSIGGGAFYNCSGLKSVTIGNSVTSIGVLAFYDCRNLTTLTVPVSLKSVGSNAFYGCNLNKVYYKGTPSQWDDISIDPTGTGDDIWKNAAKYYYSETQPTESGNYWHYDADGKIAIWE